MKHHLRDAAVTLVAIALWLSALGWVWWWSDAGGYARGWAAARAQQRPALEAARREAISEMAAPIGQAICSVASRERVIARTPCVRIAMGGWWIADPEAK